MELREVAAADEAAWRGLWSRYCAFYGVEVSADVTAGLWRRLLDPASPVRGWLAVEERPVALAHTVTHPHTWSLQPLGYLEDLYVEPEARGRGVGHALIEHLVALGKAEGWRRLYWHTNTDNATARRLYDRFGPADDYVRYTVDLSE